MVKRKYNEDVELQFIYTNEFKKIWNKYGLTDEDYTRFEEEVERYERETESPSNPLGDVISGTGGAVKYRFSGSTEPVGKSGGFRIIYGKYGRRVYAMILIYHKKDKENLSEKEKKMIKKWLDEQKKQK